MSKTSKKKVSRRVQEGQRPQVRARQALHKATRTRAVPRALIDDARLALDDQFRAIQSVRTYEFSIYIKQSKETDMLFMIVISDKDDRTQESFVPRPRASVSP